MSNLSGPFFYGFNPPFFGGRQNVMSRQEDDQLIKNDILQLILTVPGERVMRPNFGTIVRASLFEQMDALLLGRIEDSIRRAIETEEPRVIIRSVRAFANIDQHQLSINVVVSLRKQPQSMINIETFINLPSGGQ